MRNRTLKLSLAALMLLVAVWALIAVLPGQASVAESIPDDEVAFINSSGNVQIVDPSPVTGTPFNWTSSSGGWTDMAVLDSNGDGVDEIIAIGGNRAQILAPYVPGGTAPSFSKTIAGAYQFNWVATGDIVPGDQGRDEILLQHTDVLDGQTAYRVLIYDGNADGTQWTEVYNALFGIPWLRIEMGDVDGLEGDEVVMARVGPQDNRDKRLKIMKYVSGTSFATLFEQVYNFPWVDMAIGNTHDNNGTLEEIVINRDGVAKGAGSVPSFLVFQYHANSLSDAPNSQAFYYPPWSDIATGDVNASGDDEVFMVRDPAGTPSGVSLLGRNWGTDAFPSAWTSPGIQLGNNYQEVELGDVDGDGKDELLVAQPSSYRIYWDPGTTISSFDDYPTALRDPVSIKLGNFDGEGVSTEPQKLAVSVTSLQFEMTRGEANPAPVTFQVTNAGGGGAIAYNVTRQIDGNWLDVTPYDGSTPGTETVSINASNLAAGTYDGTITVTAVNDTVLDSPQIIQVRLIVNPTGPMLDVDPSSLVYSMHFGGVIPNPVDLTIRNTGDGGAQAYDISVTYQEGSDWLLVEPIHGSTDGTATVTLLPRNLAPGTYHATIRIDAGAIEASPFDVPVTLTIEATGMVVTPTELFFLAFSGKPTPVASVQIDQAVEGSGAITWRAYAVEAGDWWSQDVQALLQQGDYTMQKHGDQLSFAGADGAELVVDTLPWVLLTPDRGITPRTMQVSLDMANAPIGESRVTILVDGGPGTPNRFQGVDMRVLVSEGGVWLPIVVNE
ncbi:MAG: VCBS repeat-containing protein [Chloroflexi bacterium]|nr:VCBS repeat-containing protein [Chloroflexota bacterium]